MGNRFPFGIPRGWYVVATSDELKPGALVARSYFDREIVIYRTHSGAVSVVDAFCPHMGAHLGKVGRVDGDVLRCGFHGFQYDGSGQCVATGYDGPPPPRARLTDWEAREQNGLILVWFDPEGHSPEWAVQPLDHAGWMPIRWRRMRIATHPQETTENSVDLGHFTQLHGFVDGEVVAPLRTKGPRLTSSYAAYRPYGLPGMTPIKLRVEYDVGVTGLGYSQVDIRLPALRLHLRVWVLPVPIDDEHIDLVLGLSAETKLGPLARLVQRIGLRILCKEVGQDLDVWQYKTFEAQPALAKGDGPIAQYRAWAKQFYPEASGA